MISGNLFIITAASGAGKTSLVKALLALDAHVKLSISHTTRKPRPGETDGVDYHFVDEAHFLSMLDASAFLESAHVHHARQLFVNINTLCIQHDFLAYTLFIMTQLGFLQLCQ